MTPPAPLGVGSAAPAPALPGHTLERVSLEELYRARTTVLVFYPLAFTSTCTEELCTLRDDLADYAALGAQIVALSVDSPYVQERYRAAVGAEYLFLSDFNREAAGAFGVLREGTVGPGLLGASNRAVFVVDRLGVIRYVWHSANLGLLPPFEEIRAAVAALDAAGTTAAAR